MIELKRTDGEIWTLTLRRPERANALTRKMLRDIENAANELAHTEAAALIITGEGPVFSAGADLDEAYSGLATDDVWEKASAAIASLRCLTVCAINGTLAGGAFGIALACDIRIAVPKATFFYPVMKLGFLPQASDPGRMRDLIGPARTKMILAAGHRLNTETAHIWGLVDQVVEPDGLMPQAFKLCSDAAKALPDVRFEIKRMCSP